MAEDGDCIVLTSQVYRSPGGLFTGCVHFPWFETFDTFTVRVYLRIPDDQNNCLWTAEAELRSLTARGKRQFFGLVVWYST